MFPLIFLLVRALFSTQLFGRAYLLCRGHKTSAISNL